MIQSLVQSKESPIFKNRALLFYSIFGEREKIKILVTFQLFEATFATRVFLLMTVAMVAWMALTRLASRVTRMARNTPMRCSRMVAMRGMVASSNCSSFTLCSCFLYSIPLKKTMQNFFANRLDVLRSFLRVAKERDKFFFG